MGSRRRRLLNQSTHSRGGELHGFEVAPWSPAMDDLGLVKTVDRFCESIVVTVADASDRRLDARLRKPFGIANGHKLRAAVGMMNQPATFDGPPIMKRLVESADESRVRRSTGPPADDAAGEGVDDEGHIDEALPGRHIGDIGKPEHVRRGGIELPVHAVERTRCVFVRHRGFDWLAANDALKPHHSHEPCDSAASNIEALPLQLPPDFPNAIDLKVLVEHPAYLDLHGHVASSAGRQAVYIRAFGNDLIIRGRGNRQKRADRLDPKHRTMFVDGGNHRFSGRSSSAIAKHAEALRKISFA